jgi:hypothetical protein
MPAKVTVPTLKIRIARGHADRVIDAAAGGHVRFLQPSILGVSRKVDGSPTQCVERGRHVLEGEGERSFGIPHTPEDNPNWRGRERRVARHLAGVSR